MFSKRFELWEFGDQPWFRGWWRETYLDCLNIGLRSGGQFRRLHRVFAAWAAQCPGASVLDLGSGGGGPIRTMLRTAERNGFALPRILLSDLFPSIEHYRELERRFGSERLSYVAEPVSALAVDRRDLRLRCICSTFHHFRPDQAAALVRDAVEHADGLFIAEPLQRDLRHVILVLLAGPLPYLLAPFTADRFGWRKLLLCTLLPIVPLLVMFDGLVSVLRTYAPEEIEAMIPPERRPDVTVTHGTLSYMGIFAAQYTCIVRRPSRAG